MGRASGRRTPGFAVEFTKFARWEFGSSTGNRCPRSRLTMGDLGLAAGGGGCKRVHHPMIALARHPLGARCGVAEIAALVATFHVGMGLRSPPDRAGAKDDAVLLGPLIHDRGQWLLFVACIRDWA